MKKEQLYKKIIKDYLEGDPELITINSISKFISEDKVEVLKKNKASINFDTIKRKVAYILNDEDYLDFFELKINKIEKKGSMNKKIFKLKNKVL